VTAAALGLLLAATPTAGCSSDDGGAGGGEIVIAADLELTGTGALAGTAYERGLQLRIEQVNASGILGRRTLTLRVSDNRSDPTVSLRNISTFADDPKIAAVITGSCDECVVSAAKTINDKRLPVISLAAASEVAAPVAARRFVFKLAPNAPDVARVLVDEFRRRKVERVSALYADNIYGRDGQRALSAALAKAGITVVATSRVAPTATDISEPIGRLVKAAPDALVVWTGSEQATLAATGVRRLKFAGRLYFDAAAAGELFLPEEAFRATDDTTMVFTEIMAIDDVIATTPAKAARKQWFRDYTSRYGSYSGISAFAADAADLVARAIDMSGDDRARIRDVLETSQTDGLVGPIRFTPDNHSGLMPQALTLLAARGGRWRLLG
jgi:branched-chain amino acid transport system substrate-binding protein